MQTSPPRFPRPAAGRNFAPSPHWNLCTCAAAVGLLLAGSAVAGVPTGGTKSKNSLTSLRPAVAVQRAAPATGRNTLHRASVRSTPSGPVFPAALQIPPEPDAERAPSPELADHTSDGFPPLRGYVPGQTSISRRPETSPDRGGSATYAAFGRRSMPLVITDSDWPVPRLLPCHRPLYFEDALLERHGVSGGDCIQPGLSSLHFFGSIAIIPYKLIRTSPCSCVSTVNLCGENGEPTCVENFIGDSESCEP